MVSAPDILSASILIVDDQESNVSLLEHMLGEAGYTRVSSTMNPQQVCALHRGFEAEGTSEQKCDEIVAPPSSDVERLIDEDAALVDAIAGHIRADVRAGRDVTWLP